MVIQPGSGAVYDSATPFYGTASTYSKSTGSQVYSVAFLEEIEMYSYTALAALIASAGGVFASVVSAGLTNLFMTNTTYNAILHALGKGEVKSSFYVKYTTYDPKTQPDSGDGIFYGMRKVAYYEDLGCTRQIGTTQTYYETTVVNMHNR